MAGSDVALDTNQVIAFFNGDESMREWVETLPVVFLPVIVVGELKFGALKSKRSAANLDKTDAFLHQCTVLPISETTSFHYAHVKLALQAAGTPIPENDVWIAAACIEHGLPLATDDSHMERVNGLRFSKRGS